MARALTFCVPLLTFSLLSLSVFGQQPAPDLILFNGKIFTSNASQLYAEALAIQGERIVAVGTSMEVAALAGKETKRIDVGGRTVIPGINDAHYHLGFNVDAEDLQIDSNDPTWQEIKSALSSTVAKVPKGTWITGSFGPTMLDDPEAARAVLDALAPNDPVLLKDLGGYRWLVNTAALRKLGIHEDEPNPEAGEYVRSPSDGKLTGVAKDYADLRLGRRLSELQTEQQQTELLHDFYAEVTRLGITSIQDMCYPTSAQQLVPFLEKLPPPIRLRVIWFGLTDEHGRLTHEGRGLPLHPAPLVTVSGTKWVLDGTPIERGGAMRLPYADRPDTSGHLDFSQKEMEDMLRESLQNDDQLMVHVAGDRTAETFLNAMDATGGEKVWSKRRVRMEHGDGLLSDLVPRAKRLGVVVVQNPIHFTLPELFVKRFGEKRALELQPLRSLLEAGIPVAIGSDGPVNPFLNIMLASTFSRNPSQAVRREQAVTAYTLTSAYAEFAEKDKGSLEPGKLADFAVLSQDIFTIAANDLPKTESVLTVVGGRIIYDAKVLMMH